MTESKLRVLNTDGILHFREILETLNWNPAEEFSMDWITEEEFSLKIDEDVSVEFILFEGKIEAAGYLAPVLRELNLQDKYYHQGLWAWLSAFYFDALIPTGDKRSKPGKDYRYIPPADRSWRTVYRHLLAAPVRIFETHGERARVLLHGQLGRHGDFMEQLASRQEIASNRGIIEAVDLLYWDEEKKAPKTGARATDRSPGTLRRFVDVIQQLMVTYDLYTLSGYEILELLPHEEFSRWFPPDVTQ